MPVFTRPDPGEYNAFYRGYADSVPDGDAAVILRRQREELERRLTAVAVDRETFRYAEGKWSVRQVVGHVSDTERIFSYRALCFARGDTSALPGMDQDVFMAGSRFDRRPLVDITAEFLAVRDATLHLVESLTPDDAGRSGVASGFPVTVRALVWIIAGHAQHHLDVLADRYGI